MTKFTITRDGDKIEISEDEDSAVVAYLYDGHDALILDDIAVNGTRAIMRKPLIDIAAELTAKGLDVATVRAIDATRAPDGYVDQT